MRCSNRLLTLEKEASMSEPDLLYTSGEPDEIAELEKFLRRLQASI